MTKSRVTSKIVGIALVCLMLGSMFAGLSSVAFASNPVERPFFSQRDPAWANDLMGSSGCTIGDCGCCLTDAAMVLRYYGVDTDPGQLNTWLSNHDGYTPDGSIYWNKVSEYSNGKVEYVRGGGSLSDNDNWSVLNEELDKGYPVIVQVDRDISTAELESHWVLVTFREGSNYYINDPWDLAFDPNKLLSHYYDSTYDNTFFAWRVYHGTKFNVGDSVQTTANLNVRTGPAVSYPEITDPDYHDYAPEGSSGRILGEPENADGYIWWNVEYEAGFAGWSAQDWLERVTGEPVVSSSLRIVQSPPYYVGDTITAQFTVTNRRTTPFTFDVLTAGGRDPDDQVADFTWREDITLDPNESYEYQGSLTLSKVGNYHFFCAYRMPDGSWNTSIPTEGGATNVLDITVNALPNNPPQLSNPSVQPTSGTPSTNFYYYVSYFDPDGDDPSVKEVVIDGAAYAMSFHHGVDSQITYYYGPKNLSAGGTHYYFFYFEDGRGGAARLPLGTDMYLGPSITQPTYPPEVTTGGASSITTTSATLTGNLDSTGGLDCQAWFKYGKTTSYGSSTTPLSMSSTGPFSAIISSLSTDTTYHFRSCASNNKGTSYGSDMTFKTEKETLNNTPNMPNNVSPADGATVGLTPTLQSSDFSDPDAGDFHSASQWQIRAAEGSYSSPIFDSGTDNSNLTSIAIPSGTLDYSTACYWRVRHQDNHGAWSDWSEETSFTTTAGEVVTFPDPNLEAAIREAIDRPTGDIYRSDLEGLTELVAPSRGISNLSGLEYCTNLTRVHLSYNEISVISPLSNLTNLTELFLHQNQISDISPLSNLTHLSWLVLWHNEISDISPLSNLTNLNDLDLSGNRVSDISPLSNLTDLCWLDLSYNEVSDISPLSNLTNLTWLHLGGNSVGDALPLSELNNLTYLWLNDNNVSDISSLVANTGLSEGDRVDLRGNPLSADSLNTYIPQLEARGVEVLYDTPRSWHVDDDLQDYPAADFTAIQDAVDAASPGDTIVVRDGTYTENVEVNKSITLKGEGLPVVDAGGSDSAITITADGCVIEGFKTINSGPGSGDQGIKVFQSDNNVISKNIASNNAVGISLWQANNNTVSGNVISDNYYGLALWGASNNILRNNTMRDNRFNFDVQNDFVNDIDTSNTVDGKPMYYLVNEQNRLIDSSTNAGYVAVVNSTNIIVKDLMLTNKGQGVLLAYTQNSMVINTSNSGIQLWKSTDNTVRDNNVSDYIELIESSGNNLANNNIDSNYGCAIILMASSNNTFTYNNINSNQHIGICLAGLPQGPGSDNNLLYSNNFVNNSRNVSSSNSTNIWNSPEEITYMYNGNTYTNYLGNYWDDYTGSDANGDGIGDSPYSIYGDNDNYPLMQPFEDYGEVGYAVIVAGQGRWPEKCGIDHSANNAYRVLRNLGFDDDHILYLNSEGPQDVDGDGDDEVDAPALLSHFENAMNEVKDKIGDSPTPFILYLTGHGQRDPDCFIFDEDNSSEGYLWVSELQEMLDEFSSETTMLIVIGSCYSGRFITSNEGISAENRIIVTAAHDDWLLGDIVYFDWVWSSDRFWGNLNKGLDVKEAFTENATASDVTYRWLDDNGDRQGHPPYFLGDDGELAAATEIGVMGTDDLRLTPWLFVWKRSPGELRVYDSQDRVTGLVNGEVREEIPDSIYDEENEIVVIFSPSDTYRYEVVGTDAGTYGLDTASIEGVEASTFTATDIPTSSGAVHQYTIDWDALSQGEEGVTVQIDSDGDGIFEETVSADNQLTHDEFILQTATTIDFDSDTLNLGSGGRFATIYVELPPGYEVSQIDISSIMLNGLVPASTKPTEVGDYDSDGVADLMVKFDRAAVQEILTPGDQVEITIRGEVAGIGFKGSDSIRVIDE